MIIEEPEFLKHFGVAGMRWGVRKSKTEKLADKVEARGHRKMAKSSVNEMFSTPGRADAAANAGRAIRYKAEAKTLYTDAARIRSGNLTRNERVRAKLQTKYSRMPKTVRPSRRNINPDKPFLPQLDTTKKK